MSTGSPEDIFPEKPNNERGIHTTNTPGKISRIYKSKGVRACLAVSAILLAGGYFSKNSVNNWNNKVDGFKKDETAFIEKQRQSGQAKCLGRTLLLGSGVVYRATPNSDDYNSKIYAANWFAQSNKVGTVKANQELQVKLPKWSLDESGNSWISFTMVNKPNDIDVEPGPIKNSRQIANKTVWVNYGQLKDQKNSAGDPYIVEKILSGAPELPTDLVGCNTEEDGRTTVNNLPVAYGKLYPAGHFEETVSFMAYPKVNTP